jgi:glycosyltransferase involved in cell wall biosynthesis
MLDAMRTILMVAFHYPPYEGGSGVHRALKFSRYLSDYGWKPIVLSAHPRAYPEVSDKRLDDIPADVPVKRAFALDTARHLSIKGRYLKSMALPERWVSWWLGAVPAGLSLIRKHRPQVIWSTYPIATAHLIGLSLHRLTSIPWVADFRDSMTEDNYPPDPVVRRVYQKIERLTIKYSRHAVFTTPGTLRLYAERYPEIPRSRWAVIANGYDEEDFTVAERLVGKSAPVNDRITLLHSGILYPSERNPEAFFLALAELRRLGKVSPGTLKVVFRGCGHEDFYAQEIKIHGIEDLVELRPSIPYHDALAETLSADGLLLFQASNCNHQIPAKLYEYLRAKRPILALTDPEGDTAAVLRTTGIGTVASLDSKEDIVQGVVEFLAKLQTGCVDVATDAQIVCHSRRSRTAQLAELLCSRV